MGENLKQDERVGSFNTPLGKDELVLVRFDGTEGLSELFEFRIEALSETPDIKFDNAIGKQCTLKFKTHGQEREFSGLMVEAQWLGVRQDNYSYRVVLRPWLWLLSHTSDCRIFQDKKAPDIIKQVFKDRGFSDYEFKLTDEGSYPKLEYCVQYRETDLNFVTRLMEQHGIYYFFEHKSEKHKLILVDSKSKHEPVPGREKTTYNANIGNWTRTEERIYDWISERRFRTGKIELNDYNYLKSTSKLVSDHSGSESYTRSDMEFYDYPGKYKEKSEGEFYAKIQLEAEQAADHRRHANGDALSLYPGGVTKLERHPTDSQNIEYLIVRSTHSFVAQAYRSGTQASGEDADYYGSFEFLPKDQQFRAPIVTPKPLIQGIQTAKVVTKDSNSNEEIDVEELTEIYVRFHWMREQGDKEGKQRSCKLRVAQVWSGKAWGGQFIPRVGQEVVVEFLEGDPDRPLVVGTVYNDKYKPPYELPSKKTIAGIKSDSTKNGGGGYNEWNFEDKKGSEKITVHAEKDLDTVILHAETRTIGEKFDSPSGSASRQTTLKMGDDQLDVESGQILHTAKLKIKLTVGPSTLTIDPTGITLQAPTIKLQATGPITINGLPVKIN
jgi:type VI secretion system secreted protein VgrG